MMMFVTSVSNERETFFIVRWMMGSLDPVRAIDGAMLLPLMVPAWIVLVGSARALNQYRLGDELAAARGVNVARPRSTVSCLWSLSHNFRRTIRSP